MVFKIIIIIKMFGWFLNQEIIKFTITNTLYSVTNKPNAKFLSV